MDLNTKRTYTKEIEADKFVPELEAAGFKYMGGYVQGRHGSG